MGDRVTIQCVDDAGGFSPVLYMHWAGERALDIIRQAASVMRRGDITYAFARLVGVAHNETGPEQALSLGVFNATEIQEGDEQGDNGHFRININTGVIEHFGGYNPEQGATIEPLNLYQG